MIIELKINAKNLVFHVYLNIILFLSKQKPHTLHMHYRIESYGFGEKQQQKYGKLDLLHEIYINHVRIRKVH